MSWSFGKRTVGDQGVVGVVNEWMGVVADRVKWWGLVAAVIGLQACRGHWVSKIYRVAMAYHRRIQSNLNYYCFINPDCGILSVWNLHYVFKNKSILEVIYLTYITKIPSVKDLFSKKVLPNLNLFFGEFRLFLSSRDRFFCD